MIARIYYLILKELTQIVREPRSFILAVVTPSILLFLFGYALNLDVKNIPTAICDMDGTAESREVAARFLNSGYFELKRVLAHPREMDSLLDRDVINAGLVFPPGFGRRMAAHEKATVQILIDGSNNNRASIIQGYAQVILMSYSNRVLFEFMSGGGDLSFRGPALDLRTRVWFNQELRSVNFLVPGLIGVVIMTTTVMLTSMSVVREKERGTLEGLMVSPLRPIELILGKTIPNVIIAFGTVGLVLFFGITVFGIPFAGNLWLLMGLTALFLFGALGFGLFISTVSSTQQTAWTLGLLLTMLPSIFLSGFIFQIESMPRWVQYTTYIVPARYYLDILRGIILKGVGWTDLVPQTAALVVFVVVAMGLSAIRFRKTLP
jgi:ABC-2 type transport system permease protein